jgi:hypothetical protein
LSLISRIKELKIPVEVPLYVVDETLQEGEEEEDDTAITDRVNDVTNA